MIKEDIILKVENLSKQYRLGTVGTGTISHDLNRFFAKIRGKEDPFLKIGESNDRATKGTSEYVWALKDINFEVQKGEVLGIIGKNGAGKSTLLKILSKVTGPTIGSIKANGRIASLLEVGTGFHPEMTGKENVFLNGAILGMNKKEIISKLNEIIEFSGCKRYIDTPVKRYSSGMKVRLAFAVAAFLEPDILVIDEVLAVGDAEFQKKAIGKMQDISNTDGRTVLFVSHNMAAVKSLCTRCLVIDNGEVIYKDTSEKAIEFYYQKNTAVSTLIDLDKFKRSGELGKELRILEVICNKNNEKINENGVTGLPYHFKVKVSNKSGLPYKEISITISVYNSSGSFLFSCRSDSINKTFNLKDASSIYTCYIDKLPLNKGEYFMNLNISIGSSMYDSLEELVYFKVEEGDFYGTGKLPAKKRNGVFINYDWS
jgi:lipopolysaccharide transport system ATP-binding protein